MTKDIGVNANIERIRLAEQADAPASPASGYGYLYTKTDGKAYFKNDGGTEYDLTGGGGIERSGNTSDGNLAVWNGANADSIKDGGTPLSAIISATWSQVINESGTSYTNFTTINGTWSSDGTVIKQTDAAATKFRSRKTAIVATQNIVYEAEVQIRTAGSDKMGGIILGFNGTGQGGALLRVVAGTNKVQLECDNVAGILDVNATISTNTWYKLRLVSSGSLYSGYLDGVFIGTAMIANQANASYVGLWTYSSEVWFRNIKAWNNIALPA